MEPRGAGFNYPLPMTAKVSSREVHFPAIEKRYGQPMKHWFAVMKDLADEKYPAQIAHLRENYGFSQAHANALVMYSRGSLSASRFATPTEYYKTIDPAQAKTIKAIFKVIRTKYPRAEVVIAWNQPMVKIDEAYVFGATVATKHILISPWSADVIAEFVEKMEDLVVKKKTIGIPNDWKVNSARILSLVRARLKEVKQS